MRVLHLLTRFLRAGTEENTLALCEAQQADGHDVVLAVGRESDQSYLVEVRRRFPVHRVSNLVHRISPAKDLQAYFAICDLVRRLRPDVVHTHQSKAGILGRLAVGSGKPVMVHGVHILPWSGVGGLRQAIYTQAERFCSPFTDAFLNVSPAVRDEYVSRRIGAPERHFIMPSPIDIPRFATASWPSDWTEIVGVSSPDDKPPIILMLAAFEPRKRQRAFIEALGRVALPPETLVLFAGSGPTLEEARSAALASRWADRIRFLGHRSDPETLIALADVCVLTSEREGLPRVLVQYLAGGRATVSTALPSLKDVLVDGANALVVDTLEAAAKATAALIADPVQRGALADGARATNLSAWSLPNAYPRCQEAYQFAAQSRLGRLERAPPFTRR